MHIDTHPSIDRSLCGEPLELGDGARIAMHRGLHERDDIVLRQHRRDRHRAEQRGHTT